MRTIAATILAVIALLIPLSVGAQVDPYLQQKQKQMLYPTVIVATDGSMGSGPVIYSDKRGVIQDGVPMQILDTFILTNKHVVQSAIEAGVPVQVGWTHYDSDFRVTGVLWKIADVIGVDQGGQDIALLRLHDHENQIPFVARVAPKGVRVEVLERVWTIGSTVGQPPFYSEGVLNGKDLYFPGGMRLMRMSMFAHRGSSGGPLFHFDVVRGYEIFGIVTAIYRGPTGEKKADGSLVMEEMGNISYALPFEVIHEFLEKAGLALGIDFFK